MMAESYLEREAWLYLRNHVLPDPVREYRFAPPRLWRFDFAWTDKLVAMEIDGMGRADGGLGWHRTREGYVRDAEKYEAALRAGWRVYRVPGVWLVDKGRRVWDPRIAKTLAILLKMPSAPYWPQR